MHTDLPSTCIQIYLVHACRSTYDQLTSSATRLFHDNRPKLCTTNTQLPVVDTLEAEASMVPECEKATCHTSSLWASKICRGSCMHACVCVSLCALVCESALVCVFCVIVCVCVCVRAYIFGQLRNGHVPHLQC